METLVQKDLHRFQDIPISVRPSRFRSNVLVSIDTPSSSDSLGARFFLEFLPGQRPSHLLFFAIFSC